MANLSTRRVILTSFFVDIIDITTNLVVALLTGSAVMLAETLEGGADLSAITLVLIGAQRSLHRANSQHPFGYGKEMYFWSTLAAFVMLTITASLTFIFGYIHLISPEHVQNLPVAYAVLILAVCTNSYSLYLSARKLLDGRVWRSLPKAFMESWHIAPKISFVLDCIGTSAALVGFVALALYGITGDYRFDGIGAIIMSFILAGFAVILLMSVRSLITGRSVPQTLRSKIHRAVMNEPSVREVSNMRTMILSADSLLVNLEVHLVDGLTTDQVEIAIKHIHSAVRRTTDSKVQVYVEPVA